MSSPSNRDVGPDESSSYAPKWARDREASGRRPARTPDSEEPAGIVRHAHVDDPRTDVGLTIEGVGVAKSLKPTVLPEKWTLPRRRVPLSLAIACVITAAAGFAMGIIQENGKPREPADKPTRVAPQTRASDRQANVSAPHLVVVAQAAPLATNEALRLGVSLEGLSNGAVLLIGGLARGSAFPAGHQIGDNGWQLSGAEVGNAILTPPRGFAGMMDLAIELRLPNGTTADRKSLRLEWAAPRTAQVPASAGRRLDSNEIASLLKRGEQFVTKGDLAAARSLFQRAAEAADARAAFALAETYDPISLQRRGEQGLAPDVGMARAWYERAQELGSSEATQRLQMLASQDK
jgi:hypothetical protein